MQWVTLTFILVLGGLMTHDALRSRQVLNAGLPQLDELKLQDLDNPELAQTVRDFDYLYRATYFQTQDRRAHGFLLLGVAFFLLCAQTGLERFLFAPVLKIPEQNTVSPEQERRQILVFSICGLLVLCVILFGLRASDFRSQESDFGLQTSGSAFNAASEARSPELDIEEISLSVALEEETQHWPQFRGSVLPNRNELPAKWDFDEKWRVQIPLPGFNSPVIWNDRIFVGGGDKTERAVFCYDAKTGEQHWKVPCNHATKIPDIDDSTGFSAPTLCVDAKRVYAAFATGELICCTHDGVEIWRKLLPFPEITYGYASSPLLLGDKLIVQYDLHETQTLYALNVHTGETVWETPREAAQSWSSPVALAADGKAILFAATNKTAHAFDAETGEILWTHKGMGGEVAACAFAAPVDNAFYFSNAGAFTGAFSATDGTILCENGNVPSPDVASAVLFGDKYLLFTSYNCVIAIDAKDAKELYEESFDNAFYASPVIVQGKIVSVDLGGNLYLMDAAGETLAIEGKYEIGKSIVATPAFYQGNVIVRTEDNELLCLAAKP